MLKLTFMLWKCLSTPCQLCARLCASDCSKFGLVGGLDRITCAHNFHVTIYTDSGGGGGGVPRTIEWDLYSVKYGFKTFSMCSTIQA